MNPLATRCRWRPPADQPAHDWRGTMSNAVDVIWKHEAATPDRVALREGDQQLTWAELKARITGAADELRERGISHGDRVLMVVPTSVEFVFAYYGALSL